MLRINASGAETFRYHVNNDGIDKWIEGVKAPFIQTDAILYGIAFEQAVQHYYETNEPLEATYGGKSDDGRLHIIFTDKIVPCLLETRLLLPEAQFQVKREIELEANGERLQFVGKVDAVSFGAAVIAELKTTDLSKASAYDKYYESVQAEAYFMLFPEINHVLFMVTDRNTGEYQRVQLSRENYDPNRLTERLNDFVWAINYYGLTDYFQPYQK